MTMVAFYIGNPEQTPLLASTLAFGTLCTSRLVHGFNCKSSEPVLFTKRFFNNIYLIGAFGLGLVLITAVMLVPALHSIFQVQTLNLTQLLIMFGLSLKKSDSLQLGYSGQQEEQLEHEKYELSVCVDFYVYAGAFLRSARTLCRCRSPPLVLRFRMNSKRRTSLWQSHRSLCADP